jgi:hypothetical protein
MDDDMEPEPPKIDSWARYSLDARGDLPVERRFKLVPPPPPAKIDIKVVDQSIVSGVSSNISPLK